MAEREPALYQRVASALDDLQRDPHQGKPLKGKLQGRYSYRVGSYRIVYLVRQQELLVLIIDIGHRWQLATHTEDLTRDQIGQRAQEFFAGLPKRT